MNNDQIQQFILEIDYPRAFPVVIKAMGLTKRQYSRLISKSENWFYSRENGGKKFNVNDFRRLELLFRDMFPKQNFHKFVYDTLKGNEVYYSKSKLLNEIKRLKEVQYENN